MKGLLTGTVLAALLPWAAAAAPSAPPPARFNDASIRNFIEQQERLWNTRAFALFYATFAPQATIATVHRGHGGPPTRSVRTLAQDRHAAEKFFASSHADIREADWIEHIAIHPGARRATVRVRETTTIKVHGKVKVLHAVTEQVLVWRDERIVSLGLREWDDR